MAHILHTGTCQQTLLIQKATTPAIRRRTGDLPSDLIDERSLPKNAFGLFDDPQLLIETPAFDYPAAPARACMQEVGITSHTCGANLVARIPMVVGIK